KDVFAIPGKTTDAKSEGCNYLIRHHKALLVTAAQDIIENMGWEDRKITPKKQRELFIELSGDERTITDILKQQEQVHIDELYLRSNLSSSAVAAALLTLEMQSVIASLPGKMYRLI
ncbi:MAG TPA: DNA-protecting protein DprA, partial [Bacteroidia bacterium]|nr:DNA-protecting protein DprA [Bacteroidia bacterium]